MLCGVATAAAPSFRAAAPRGCSGRGCAPAPRPERLACVTARASSRKRGPPPAGAFFRGLFPGGGGDDAAPPPAPPDEDLPPPWLTPPYAVVRATPGYELRVYSAYTAANTAYDQRRDEGLQRLAEYCDGANGDAVQLAATQPLTMRYDPAPGVRVSVWRVRRHCDCSLTQRGRSAAQGGFVKSMELFVGPRRGAAPTATPPAAPVPSSPEVSLRAAGGEAVAALVITGNVTPTTALAARKRLVGASRLALCRDALLRRLLSFRGADAAAAQLRLRLTG